MKGGQEKLVGGHGVGPCTSFLSGKRSTDELAARKQYVIVTQAPRLPQLKEYADTGSVRGMFRTWKVYLPIVLILFVSLLPYRDYLLKGKILFPANLLVSFYTPWSNEGLKAPNKPIGFDNVRQMLPYKQFTKESLQKGQIPLWNPSVFAGNPHISGTLSRTPR